MLDRILLFSLAFLICPDVSAQQDSTWQKKTEITISTFADVFYVYDFQKPQGTQRQSFLFNHNRHNEFNLNLGLLKLDISHANYRARLGLQTGTYALDNYAAEPGLLRNMFEATVGIALNSKKNLWLDAGVLPSYIGFESAISVENMTLTRSLLAENSPYFVTGAKITYSPNSQWELAGLILNGWQRIQRLEGNSLPALGTQVQFHPDESLTLNWSTFLGTDDPDSSRRMRYFNNLYGKIRVLDKLDVIAGFDLGFQQRSAGSSTFDFWLSPILIGQYHLTETWKIALRAEYYQDETGIIIPTETPNGFQTTGLSLNVDYAPAPAIRCRIEGRWLSSKDPVLNSQMNPTQNNFSIATSLAIKLDDLFP